jgi:hypothetical protein
LWTASARRFVASRTNPTATCLEIPDRGAAVPVQFATVTALLPPAMANDSISDRDMPISLSVPSSSAESAAMVRLAANLRDRERRALRAR